MRLHEVVQHRGSQKTVVKRYSWLGALSLLLREIRENLIILPIFYPSWRGISTPEEILTSDNLENSLLGVRFVYVYVIRIY